MYRRRGNRETRWRASSNSARASGTAESACAMGSSLFQNDSCVISTTPSLLPQSHSMHRLRTRRGGGESGYTLAPLGFAKLSTRHRQRSDRRGFLSYLAPLRGCVHPARLAPSCLGVCDRVREGQAKSVRPERLLSWEERIMVVKVPSGRRDQ